MVNKKGTALLMVFVDIDTEQDADFNDWYNQEHVADLLALPGFLNGARYDLVTWPVMSWRAPRRSRLRNTWHSEVRCQHGRKGSRPLELAATTCAMSIPRSIPRRTTRR